MASVSLKYRKLREPPDSALVQVVGTLDAATIVTFEGSLLRLRTEGLNKFVLDLSEVGYMSSTGVGSLVKLADGLRAQAGGLLLCSLQPNVRLSFNLLGLGSVLPIFESASEAAQALAEQFAVGPDGESRDPSAASSILRGYDANPTDVSVIDGIFARVALKLGLATPAQVAQAVAVVGERGPGGPRPSLRDALVTTGALTRAQSETVLDTQARVQLVCPRCNRIADMHGSWSEGSLCGSCQVPLRLDLPSEPYDPRAMVDAIAAQDTMPLPVAEFRDLKLGPDRPAASVTPNDSWVGQMLDDALVPPQPPTDRRSPSGLGPAPMRAAPVRTGWLDERTALIVVLVALLAGLAGWLLRAVGR